MNLVYENYGPDAIIAGAFPLFASLDPNQDWAFDANLLEKQIQEHKRVRALILNTPNNPTGKVFCSEELARLAWLAQRYDFYVITDEIYEHIIYDGKQHSPIALLPGMKERTITISALSKTFSVTGWRLGYILAHPDLSVAIRKMHDFLTVGAAAPLQDAGAKALAIEEDYYCQLADEYTQRRNYLMGVLKEARFQVWKPSGAYYIMADISPLTELNDVQFVQQLLKEYGIAAVPGSSFYHNPELGKRLIRFAFCKTFDVLQEAADRLTKLR